jgi:hypothetical protein
LRVLAGRAVVDVPLFGFPGAGLATDMATSFLNPEQRSSAKRLMTRSEKRTRPS